MESNGLSEKEEGYYQRLEMENYLKVAITMLSNATQGAELARLLNVTAFLDRQDVAQKLI